MLELIKFELKKLFNKKLNIIVFIGCILLVAFVVVLSYQDYFSIDEQGVMIRGKAAIEQQKEDFKEISGPLTNKRVYNEIAKLKEISKDESNGVRETNGALEFRSEIGNTYFYKRMELLSNINSVFAKNETGSMISEILYIDLKDAKNFYKSREDALQYRLNKSYKGKTYSNAEKEYWTEKAGLLKTPVEYEYSLGWARILNNSEIFMFGILAICICLSSVFSNEYQYRTDRILLSTKYGKNKLVTAKIIASYIFATVVFFVYMVLMVGGLLLFFGADGGNLPIQSYFMLSPYSITLSQAVFINIALSYVIILGFGGFTLFLSSKVNSSLSVLVANVALIMIPTVLLPIKAPVGLWNKVLSLLPNNASMPDFTKMISYSFGGFIINLLSMIAIVYIIIMIVTLISARKSFINHQVG